MEEELRERKSRRLNLVLHGVPEPGPETTNPRDRIEMDKGECEKIFGGMRVRTRRQQIRFCRRVGERGLDPRPIVIGLNSEEERRHILERSRELRHTLYESVTIVPDLTKSQRQRETRLRVEADRRNQELSGEDIERNLKWIVVGSRGEKRLIKGTDRKEQGHGQGGPGGRGGRGRNFTAAPVDRGTVGAVGGAARGMKNNATTGLYNSSLNSRPNLNPNNNGSWPSYNNSNSGYNNSSGRYRNNSSGYNNSSYDVNNSSRGQSNNGYRANNSFYNDSNIYKNGNHGYNNSGNNGQGNNCNSLSNGPNSNGNNYGNSYSRGWRGRLSTGNSERGRDYHNNGPNRGGAGQDTRPWQETGARRKEGQNGAENYQERERNGEDRRRRHSVGNRDPTGANWKPEERERD